MVRLAHELRHEEDKDGNGEDEGLVCDLGNSLQLPLRVRHHPDKDCVQVLYCNLYRTASQSRTT